MNPTLTPLKKFKHDTVGKFQSLKELIEYINENNLHEPDSQEILIELKETFNKMASATEKLIKK
jgi:hypothetical protein